MEQKSKVKIGSVLKGYMAFMIIVCVILLIGAAFAFMFDVKAGFIAAGVFLVVFIGTLIFVLVNQKRFTKNMITFARSYESMENRMIKDLPLPYAIVDRNGTVFLYNERFSEFYKGAPEEGNLSEIFAEIKAEDLRFSGDEKDISISFNDRFFRVHMNKLQLQGQLSGKRVIELPENEKYFIAVYLLDETEIVNMMHKMQESQVIIGSILIDNYAEIFDHYDSVSSSLIAAKIDKIVTDYFNRIGSVVKKTEKDKYFVIFERKHLAGLQRSKFDLLDEIRRVETESDNPLTLSVGIGVGSDYNKGQTYAKQGLELALGRGGDQVVLKEGERVYFYGGKTKSVEKNTRVKARITALNLKEVIQGKDHVVIMGHKISDPDCFGAAVGLKKAAEMLERPAYIILNELNNSVQPILENFLDNEEYGENVFVPADQAADYVDNNTALIIVDVNRPDIFECPELVNRTKTVVMIDHHLQSGDRVENVELSYVEPTASSASEMVTELLQYISGDMKLSRLEAEALYAGILIDTDYFTKNTGVRTFEAAAYLRRNGVDIGRVNDLFSDTLEDFKLKAETIKTAEMFENGYALAVSPSEGVDNPTIVAAQVANELLTISGVRASFVLVDYNRQIYISARSKSDVNVQLIMERMGGGGHMTVAGTQLAGSTVEDAKRKLKQTVKKMIEEEIIK